MEGWSALWCGPPNFFGVGYRAIELEPNGANSHYHLGMGLNFADRSEEAIPILKKAIRLNPIASGLYLHHIAIAFRMMEQYDKAVEYAEKSIQRSPTIITDISIWQPVIFWPVVRKKHVLRRSH